ncbi:phage baseplate upper protein [Weissella viridescens]|mgnify:CR=1 FL=1|jgi:hypothetical protein|uniref:BppU family phage baseplate upper protein n=2 Tax=Weissella TaxID=46255 RepID=UPI001C7CAA34|nr:BppU family phage baseplate upper protein [Weissella viridescens]MBX4172549.1 phage baseplate upper protein [Weissella viridescens]MCB6839637.1 phage baseplate upper protein [Weissella viridescens]MCB6846368.1 phage baseplate upper protein [Weissella viridescens]
MTTKEESTIPLVKQGIYAILDTTLKSQEVMWFDEMSGDYGDAGRTVYLAIKDRAAGNDPKKPLKPMDLTGKDVRLQGHDAQGMFKRISLSTKIDNAQAGLVQMTLPRQLYQSVGAYENAEFEVYETSGNTVISTVPVGFEVYNNHAHMVLNDSQVYVDEFEELKRKLESSTDDEIDMLNKKFGDLIAQVSIAKNSVEALKQLVATWTKNVEDKAVALLNGNNQFTGKNNEFLYPVSGFMTGITNKIYTVNDSKQDVNDINKLRGLPEATTTVDYYSNNGTLNNPMESNYFMVETRKVTRDTAFQTITNMNLVDGEVKQRTVQAMTTQPVFGNWYTTAKWSPWRTLVPYLSDKFVVGTTVPQYRFNGSSVIISGDISPKETIPNETGGEYTLFDKLPFNFSAGQQQVQIGSGNTVFGYFTTNNRIVMQKYMFAGKDAPIIKGGYIGIAGNFAVEQ